MMKPCRPLGAKLATSSPKPRRPRGFTLLEVLVALSLSLLLISAIYASVRLYYRFSTSGHEDVERTLLARALLRRIELDVRSVMYRAAAPATTSSSTQPSSTSSPSSPSSPSNTPSSSSTSSSSSSSSTTPEDSYNTSNTGLYGNMTTLLMHVSKPGHEQMAALLAAMGNTQMRTSDLVTVAYFVSGTASGILQQATSSPGLARLEGDRLALAMADQESSIAFLASKTEILAPEVDAIKFTYFDGFQWRNDWDSNILGGMPKAIEVLVELRPAPSQSQGGGSSAPNVYRLLIAIPLAKPIDTSLSK